MDVIIEILGEIIIGGLIDCISEGAESSSVPRPLRIICSVVLLLLFAGLTALCIILAAVCIKDGQTGFGILMLIIGILIAGGTVAAVIRTIKKYIINR